MDISDRGTFTALFNFDAECRPAFASFIDGLPSAVYYKSADGTYAGCNKAYADLIGQSSPDSVRGKTDFDLFPKRTADRLFEYDGELLDGTGSPIVETKLPGSDGRDLNVLMHRSVFRGKDDQTVGIVGIVVDLTDQRRIEAGKSSARAMAAAAESAIQTMEGMIDPVIILDSNGRIERMNRGSGELFGLTRPLLGTDFASLFLNLSSAEGQALLRRCRDRGRIRDLEAKVLSFSGEIRQVCYNLSVLQDSQRALDAFVLSIHDVTGLVSAYRKMDAVINASEDAVFLVDGDDVIRAGNRALADRFGEPPEALIGRNINDLPDRDVHDVRRRFIEDIRREKKPARVEYESGNRTFYSSGFPIFDSDGGVRDVAVFSYDITDRKRNEEELRRKNFLLKGLTDGTTLAFVKAVEIRDPYTAGHQQRVSRLSYALAEALGLEADRRDATRLAALLHDVGKISVPAELLAKPGKLTDLEFLLIRQHPLISEDILKSIDFPYPIARFVREHHEKMDGSGYPDGLAGDEISLESRVICVADVVDAIVSHRPYRPSRGLDFALTHIASSSGVLYDKDVVDACVLLFNTGAFSFEPGLESRPGRVLNDRI